MACSVPHTDDEVEALVQKLIDEDMVRQKAIMDLALQFDNACTAKDDLRKAYEKCGSSSQTREICDVYHTEKELHQLHLDEEALREILEEEARDEKEREEKIRQKQADDEEFMLEFGVKYDSEYEIIPGPAGIVQAANLNYENDQWELSLDIDDCDLRLTPVMRPSSSTCVETSHSTQNSVRIIPGPADIVQAAYLLKQRDILLGLDEAVMSTQEYMKKVVEDVGEDEDFKSGSWVSATDYVNANDGTISECLGDIKNFIKNG
ncbi:hypothetical protein Tco_0892287 [Tanacetum coccineum]|uniref:Uncharacterized protein n=1 Tax=Tanacetum coccineum TaxID=301880 RepID=A0ABQ5C5F8_9ASTR